MLLYNFLAASGIILLAAQLYFVRTKKIKWIFPTGVAALILIAAGMVIRVQESRKKKTGPEVSRAWHGLTDGGGETTGMGWVV